MYYFQRSHLRESRGFIYKWRSPNLTSAWEPAANLKKALVQVHEVGGATELSVTASARTGQLGVKLLRLPSNHSTIQVWSSKLEL